MSILNLPLIFEHIQNPGDKNYSRIIGKAIHTVAALITARWDQSQVR